MRELNSNRMKSIMMLELLERCRTIAGSDKTILIFGEVGTGKGRLAKYIHEISERRECRFYIINCYSMLAEEVEKTLFNGNLFSYDQAAALNLQLLEKLQGGTLFLDGFEMLPVQLQQQILAMANSQEPDSSYGARFQREHFRLIASVQGHFFMGETTVLNIDTSPESDPHIIFIPPLRNRREDIPPLIHHFIHSLHENHIESEVEDITPFALYICLQYHWPGNIRQLKNAIRLAMLLSDNTQLKAEHLPRSIRHGIPQGDHLREIHQSRSFQQAEKNLFRNLIVQTDSTKKVAEILKMNYNKFEEKVDQYHLSELSNGKSTFIKQ